MKRSLADLSQLLCAASRRKTVDPYTDIEWPDALEPSQWFTSPELVSLYGTPAWDRLDDHDRKQLSLFEAVNFYSLNVHGEKALVEGLVKHLYDTADSAWSACSPYLHHFIAEENHHMVYFGGFCERYANKIYRDRKISLPRKYAPGEEDFLFFARVLVFEEVVDALNRRMARDERLAPIARRINQAHHLEETRHLVFGRRITSELFRRHSPQWSRETLDRVRGYLESYVLNTWRDYANPDVYVDLGLAQPYDLAEEMFHDEGRRVHWRAMTAGCVRYLLEQGMIERAPV
ncbi:MAG: diiron oxygenase [Planctomycetota bacterium]